MSDQKKVIKDILEAKKIEEQNYSTWYVIRRTFESRAPETEERFRIEAPDLDTALVVAIFAGNSKDAQEGGAKYTQEAIEDIVGAWEGSVASFLNDMFVSEFRSNNAVSGPSQDYGAVGVGKTKELAKEFFDKLDVDKGYGEWDPDVAEIMEIW